eukprot:m51a1_g11050 hypothetical protein (223) ;mRNA; f:504844-505512
MDKRTLWLALHVVVVVTGALHLPLVSLAAGHKLFLASVGSALAVYALCVWWRVQAERGTAPLDARRAAALVAADDNAHYVFYCLLALNCFPLSGAVVPLLLYSVRHVSSVIAADASSRLQPYAARVMQAEASLLAAGCLTEILNAASLLVLMPVFGGIKWAVVAYGYTQFLRLRYLSSPATRLAWGRVNSAIDGFLARFAPSVVLSWYRAAANYTHRCATPQ